MKNNNHFRSKNLLVTGGAGFIGSNFITHLFDKYEDLKIFNLDLLTYAGNADNINKFNSNKNYKFIHGDICSFKVVNEIFKKYSIDGVINFAAESHVDNSIKFPDIFIKTNINGTFNLLKCCYLNWMISPGLIKNKFENARFHQVSTDEVYGSIDEGSFTEASPYNPNSPYSSSKASADMIVRSFHITYGLNTTISISSNNFGENQNTEKFIPKIFDCFHNSKTFPLYGNGKNIRDWLHVKDNCNAIDVIFNKSVNGDKFNVASGNEFANIEIITLISKILKKEINYEFVKDRFGHDFRYSLNATKLKKQLGWSPNSSLEDFIKKYRLK